MIRMKGILLGCVLTLIAGNAFAADAYVSGGAGYNLGIANTGQGIEKTATGDRELKFLDYGSGINFGVTGGYNFGPNLALELGVGYFTGSQEIDGFTTGTALKVKNDFQMITLNPSIVVKSADAGFAPYAKFGFLLGLAPKLTQETTSGGTTNKNEFTEGMPKGVTSAVGFLMPMGGMKLFAEVKAQAANYLPGKMKNQAGQETSLETEVAALATNKSITNSNILSSVGAQVGVMFEL